MLLPNSVRDATAHRFERRLARHTCHFQRGLRPRNPVLGEVSEGAVEAPSDEDGGRSPPPSQRTSSVSRSPSPTRLMARTVSARKRPGNRMIQNASCTYVLPSRSEEHTSELQ